MGEHGCTASHFAAFRFKLEDGADLREGSEETSGDLFDRVYTKLRQLAHGQRKRWEGEPSLQTTALAHEAYLDLVGPEERSWENRSHFFAVAEATAGDEAPARKLLARYQKKRDRPSFGIGLLQAALGRRAEALDTFEAVFRRRETSGGDVAIRLRYFYPDVLGPLRADPRWEELIRTINVGWGLNPDGSLPAESPSPATPHSRE